MQNGDFLLIDAGAEYNGYGTDITSNIIINLYYELIFNINITFL